MPPKALYYLLIDKLKTSQNKIVYAQLISGSKISPHSNSNLIKSLIGRILCSSPPKLAIKREQSFLIIQEIIIK